MKDYRQANRGRPFEELLKMVHANYQRYGAAVVHKIPTEFLPIRDAAGKIVSCKVEDKSCVDYLGRYYNIPVAVEAKHTMARRIKFSEVQDHQAAFMDDFCDNPGAVGLVLVSFSLCRFYAVPWQFWKAARTGWQTGTQEPVTAYGQTWTPPGKASASPEELHPEWEVRPGGAFVLPYLHTIEILSGRSRRHG